MANLTKTATRGASWPIYPNQQPGGAHGPSCPNKPPGGTLRLIYPYKSPGAGQSTKITHEGALCPYQPPGRLQGRLAQISQQGSTPSPIFPNQPPGAAPLPICPNHPPGGTFIRVTIDGSSGQVNRKLFILHYWAPSE